MPPEMKPVTAAALGLVAVAAQLATAAAFSEGQGDFSVEFEPHATSLEKAGKGYVIASLGEDSGYVPYTAFCAKGSYIEENPDVIQSFTNALQKGMDYVQSHTPEEIAKAIAPQFEETDIDTITTIVTRYYEQDTWKADLIFEKESFDLLQDILDSAGELSKRAPYGDLVNTDSDDLREDVGYYREIVMWNFGYSNYYINEIKLPEEEQRQFCSFFRIIKKE